MNIPSHKNNRLQQRGLPDVLPPHNQVDLSQLWNKGVFETFEVLDVQRSQHGGVSVKRGIMGLNLTVFVQ